MAVVGFPASTSTGTSPAVSTRLMISGCILKVAASRSFRLYLTGCIAAAAIFCSPSALFAAQHVPPSFLTQPASVAVPAGQSASFFVVASGSPTLAYQWRFNGTDIPGATDTNLVVINASSSNAGPYSVQVTNLYGTTNSSNATLTVNYPPVILVHPVSQAALLGSNVAFQVTATGTPAFGYRWQ